MTDPPHLAAPPAVDVRELAAELALLIGEARTPPLLTAAQAGPLLGVPASWLLGEARSGRVPHVRLGRYVRFARADLLEWVDARKQGSPPLRRAG
ncbi:MAG: Helix-turn-helix domain [Gaiellaceae bacterium]|jgi:excisionase family DNA binding protein|nr:Helix-turn-helix domain [Gaiellaceae bacterium]